MTRVVMIAILALGLTACAPQTPSAPSSPVVSSAQAALIADGRAMAQGQCSRCHAIGAAGESPNPQAPVFRHVLSRYRADVLSQELMEGVRVTHPMPDFQFSPQGVDALIAYLQSIQTPEQNH